MSDPNKKARIGIYREFFRKIDAPMLEIEEGVFVNPHHVKNFSPKIQKQVKEKLATLNK